MSEEKEVPTRGKGKKTLMLDAIRAETGSEHEFLREVVKIGLGGDSGDPNPTLLGLVISRIEPPLKSTSPLVEFDFDKDLSVHEQAAQIITAMSKGKIAPDVGQMLISSISSMLKIQEVTDIEDRLKAMEQKIESPS